MPNLFTPSRPSSSPIQRLLMATLVVVALFLLAAFYEVAQGQVRAAHQREAQARIQVQTAAETRTQRERLTAAFQQPIGVQSVAYTLSR
ncbi:hypothetical protein [Pseudacidovorax sp. RU35E]|jgi:uncharacterized protein HemX|uniref:hypothetical protein n=1 Tax=Pseudacidovorax sp. RU35E TaxID=1907403 RepID=UPI0009562F62|nr:hypothetical protein [Pseudacidovorax sp. RU35E]SIR04976.1 hypothetical protein SAMN05880557_107246 [Pseudacidovorax sp. RU35E]